MKRVLVGCEESGTIRDMFSKIGWFAVSCDLLPTRTKGYHYQGDVLDILSHGWDLFIAHPECTRLTVAANKWYKPEYKERFPNIHEERKRAVDFFLKLVNAPVDKICIENPIGIMSSIYKKPTQIIQPHYFGDSERKATCLWLKNLPPLDYRLRDNLFGSKTNVEPDIIYHKSGRTDGRLHFETLKLPKEERRKARSVTFPGIAKAMAEQWG